MNQTVTTIVNRQEGVDGSAGIRGVAVLEDGSTVAGGFAKGTWGDESLVGPDDFAAVKLHPNGTLAWRWSVSR